MTYWLLPLTLPLVIQAHAVAGLAFCFGLWGSARYQQGVLVCEWRPWFGARWRFTTTIAYAMGTGWGGPSERLWAHEIVHIRQAEDLAVVGALVGAVCAAWHPWLGLCIWCTSGPLWQVPNFVTALPRYRRLGRAMGLKPWEIMYYGSEHERSAYSQTSGRSPL